MRKFLYALALVALMALPFGSQAQAAGMYITPKFLDSLQSSGSLNGGSGLSGQTWNSIGGALAVGANLREMTESSIPLRFEFEYATRGTLKAEWNGSLGLRAQPKASWQVQTFQLNGYWDIDTGTIFTPYIGAGIGASYIRSSMTSGPQYARHYTEDSSWGLAWNVGAGAAISLTDSVALDVGYRFAGFGESSIKHMGNNVTNYMTANEFTAGVRFSF